LLPNNPPIIIDGGHNRQGAKVLRESLETYFPGQKITFVLGILQDKEVKIILDELMPIADKCYTVAVDSPRTMAPVDLANVISSYGVEAHVISDTKEIKEVLSKSKVGCIAGSLYLIKDAQVDTTNWKN
jgi:dihydrofolate synthase/folylpolyglutamate synthase